MKRIWSLLALLVLLAGLFGPTSFAQGPDGKAPTPTQAALPPNAEAAPQKAPEEPATAAGPLALWPGPDGFNYVGAACPYTWVDITSTGTPVAGLTDDSYAGPFSIGHTFPFYGTDWTEFFVSSNGFVALGAGSSTLSNQCPLPNSTTPNTIIPIMWDDLYPNYTTGGVFYQSFANCPVGTGNCLVVEYYNWAHCCSSTNIAGTWEAILYQNGRVMLQFLDGGSEEGASSTTGIEGNDAPGDHGLTYACNTAASIVDGTCIQMQPLQVPMFQNSFKTAPAMARSGERLTYRVGIVNSGPVGAPNTTMLDPIPPGTTFFQVITPTGLIYNPAENRVEWTGPVPPGGTVQAVFEVDVDAGLPCPFAITNTAVISAPGALAPALVEATTGIWGGIYYASNLEPDNGALLAGGTSSSWSWGTPTSGPGSAHSGSRAWATNLAGSYNSGEDSYIVSPPIDLSPAYVDPTDPLMLEWWQWLQTESSYDYASLEVRAGGSDWTALYGPVDGSVDLAWTHHAVDLSPYIGYPNFQFRFHLTTDSSVTYPGWYVDDVSIHQCAQPLPGLYLGPNALLASGCNGITQTHMFSLYNNTGSDGTFAMTYGLNDPAYGTISGPASVDLNQGRSLPIEVVLAPALCIPGGTEIVADITAAGNGYQDTSILTKTVFTGLIPEWVSGPPTPTGTRYHAAVHSNGYLYQIGGESGWWAPLNGVRRLNLASGVWEARAPLPVATYGTHAVAIGDLIFMPGGSDDTVDTNGPSGHSFLNTLAIYDTLADSWSAGPAMPAERAYPAVVTYGGLIYVIGGEQNDGTYVNTLFIFDPLAGTWTLGTPMAEARGYAAAAAIDGKIYVAGGFVGGTTVLDTLEIYDIATGTWSAGPDLPKAWASFGDGSLGNRYLVVYNGDIIAWNATDGTTYSCSTDASLYDTLTSQWIALPALNRCLYGSEGDGFPDRFYLVSGRTNEGGWQMSPAVEFISQCPSCDLEGWITGAVMDAETGGVDPTCTDAFVHLEPGGLNVPANPATGHYGPLGVAPWTYTMTAMAPGYSAESAVVTVVDGMTTTQDFGLWRPIIAVDPTSISVTAPVGVPATVPLAITNEGHAPLYFELLEVPPGVLALDGGAPQGPSTWLQGSVQIDPKVLAELEQGPTAFYVRMRQQADLSPAFDIHDWSQRGWFVYDALKAAAAAQDPIVAYAKEAGLEYHSFLIDNQVFLRGATRTDLDALAARSDVYAIRGEYEHPLDTALAPAGKAGDAWGWNLDLLDPDAGSYGMQAAQVWQELGILGNGIVVANIDTGAYYQHEALVAQYRGTATGDHNYNWWHPESPTGCDGSAAPCDNNGHGSGTIGIMAGQTPDLAEQIGVAPGATWMACKGCATSSCSDFALNACADFMVAPWDLSGANPNPDMRPHVINNSWGGGGCDTWYQGKIQAWVAAGQFPAFSAGNTVACNAVGSPGDNPEAFGTAAHDSSGGNLYAGGPSCFFATPSCDPSAHQVDPHLNAPTFGRTAGNTAGAYYQLSGTSGASPHTAGCVALIWDANPNLIGDWDATFTLLEQSADRTRSDPGAEGICGKPACAGSDYYPNYEYGWGYLDCYAAVEMAVSTLDVSWVWEDPISGTIPPTETQVVDLTFQCALTDVGSLLTATLRILHNAPCQDNVDIPLEFFCAPPCNGVDIVTVTTAISGCVVDFAAALTGDPPVSYEWDFGALGTSTDPAPIVDFLASGTYPYTLTARNCYGTAVDVYVGEVTVECVPPCVGVDLITITTALDGCVVDFGAEVTGDPPITFAWDFAAFGASTAPTPTVDFLADGTYGYTLTVSNCAGANTDTLSGTVTVACGPHWDYFIYLPVIYK